MPDESVRGQEIRDQVAASPFHAELGIRVTGVREGKVDLTLEGSDRHANLGGTLHGGVIATLADTAAGLAVRSQIEPGTGHVTVNLDVQYLRPGTLGRVDAHGRVVRMGRSIAFAEADVVDGEGRVLARAQVTVALAPAKGADG